MKTIKDLKGVVIPRIPYNEYDLKAFRKLLELLDESGEHRVCKLCFKKHKHLLNHLWHAGRANLFINNDGTYCVHPTLNEDYRGIDRLSLLEYKEFRGNDDC